MYPDEAWDHTTYSRAAITIRKAAAQTSFGSFCAVWSWDHFWCKVDAWGGTVVDPNDAARATFDSDQVLARSATLE